MKAVKDIDDVIKTLRVMLISQSQLPAERVLNALSLQGTELDKLLNDSIYDSIEQPDTTLLFELLALPSSSNVSMEEGDINTAKLIACSNTTICSDDITCGEVVIDRSITYYKMYQLKLIMYGSSSSDIAVKLSSRIRSQQVRSDMYTAGIYIESVSDPDILNEFKNDIMWLRNDITVNIGLKFKIAPAFLPSEYKTINEMNIIKEGIYE